MASTPNSDVSVECPPLITADNSVMLSTISSSVGTMVEFLCADPVDILSGPKVLECLPRGIWNGSVPQCLSPADISAQKVTNSTQSTTSQTYNSPETEAQVILIVLWVSGGVLLLSLIVLLTCILRNHRKQRRDGAQNQSIAAGQPRQGSVNPTFSNYDEIWTWIPIVTGNSGNCRSHVNPIVRNAVANNRNRELLNNLRLPTYSEAINSNANSRNQPSHTLPVRVTSEVTATYGINNNNSVNNRYNSQRGSAARAREANATHILSSNNMPTHALVTEIPPTLRRDDATGPISCTTQNDRPNHVTNITIGASRTSALQQARALVNQCSALANGNRPIPSAPSYSRDSTLVCARGMSGMQSRNEPSSPARSSPSVTDVRQSSDYSGEIRQASLAVIALQNPRREQPIRVGFNHSHSSAFAHVTERHIRGSQGLESEVTIAATRTSARVIPSSGTMRSSMETQYF
ncbi:hypothetical protein DPMN_036374 [Dreissena polymorpha]|uniref:Sushi domain-containing protein n=2 Tax=Dreissena polymorpha TaxID=45954 RepID=A0A9D4MCU5_DREPO|nr:hypothetical protein DPMN_036374 [Dreissena polymorpha]